MRKFRFVISAILIISLLVVLGVHIDSGATKRSITNGPAAHAFDQNQIRGWVERYDSLGHKRTGEPADLATTDWLETHFNRLGYDTRRQGFSIGSYRVESTTVEIDGQSIEAFPQFPVTFTDGISAPLKRYTDNDADYAGHIVWLDLERNRRNNSLAQERLETLIRKVTLAGGEAVLLMVRAECGAPKMLNAPMDIMPFDVPVILVGERDAETLEQATTSGEPVAVSVRGAPFEAEAFNLIAEIGPADKKPIVISTPQSGWFDVAAERGSGFAVFLALSEWAAQSANRRFMFVSNSGHERGNVGAHKLIESIAPSPGDASRWIHIGANVGAAEADETGNVLSQANRTRYLMTKLPDTLRAWTLFRGQPGFGRPLPLELGQARGELKTYHEAGYRGLAGVFGPGPFHHCTNDRADKVDIAATRDVALSLAAFIDATAK